ncbi:MAG: YeeE/YedE family protein [Methanomicrobiaceae archaeon]|uniref:Uncharacterized protein n=1 Tax=hydrocarbon metagenome TaxID=938273 RepID=A0A0W8FJQ8_9ZZZZ|nr:YeeE/YedE family protein [Methanomicrobiaceae archaeon]MDD5420131.1 YeeE/YedE thiosulfate transporter family protein [Methanomicrobiaceae archaeon]
MNPLAAVTWSPYVVGIGIGILSWLTFLLSNRPLGCSTAFFRTFGMIECRIRGDAVRERPYYRLFPPTIDWQWMLVAGVIIGAFLSAALSGTFFPEWVPDRFGDAFGYRPGLRILVAFIGGLLMGLGARWAGGCTSGHGISGSLQLSLASWIAAICFFAGGIVTAAAIYGGL